jgi:hypothetical protein
MALAYVPPGVNIEELYSPSVNPLLAVNAQLCFLGLAQGYEVASATVNMATDRDPDDDTIVLTAPQGTVFAPVSGSQAFPTVVNYNEPDAGSNDDGSYKQSSAIAADTDFTAVVSGDKKTITITPTTGAETPTPGSGAMDLNTGYVVFTYRYVDANYYVATRYDNTAAIEQRYGPAFDRNGIVTPLTAACIVAFENGADSIVVQPVYTLSDADDPNSTRNQPTIGVSGTYFDQGTWAQSLTGIRDIEDINVITPVVGQSQGFSDAQTLAVFFAVQDHMQYMSTQGQLICGVFGEDSSADATKATAATLRDHARQLRQRLGGQVAEATVLASPSRFKRRSSQQLNTDINLGGQYAAAALSGMLANRPTTQPLTRKAVGGFSGVSDPRDKSAKDADAAAGLLVIEPRGQSIQVRHGLTVDTSGTARRELSVVRAKHRMIESIRDTLEAQVIGQVPADGNANLVVKQAVMGVLEFLRGRRELVDYNGVQARTLTNDPTTVECRFSYRPAFPLNYINILFSLDLSSGDISSTTFGDSTLG